MTDTENTKATAKYANHARRENSAQAHSKYVKTVTKPIWADYIELCEDIRHTPKYKKRKETIERVFADAKEKHAMCYTPYRGLDQVRNWVRLKFAAMNLKKYAKKVGRSPPT